MLEKCFREIQKAIKEDSDSVYVYHFELQSSCVKRVIGCEKEKVLNLIS